MHQVAREGWTRVSTNLAENITGMRVVTAFNRQEPNLGVFNRLQDDNTDNNVRVARINGVYQPLLELDRLRRQGRSSCCYGGYLVVTGRIAPGGRRRGRRGVPVLGLVHEPDPATSGSSTTS